MKIIDLTFQNLNSIAGEPVHIDFGSGPLAEAGIFAITGPTGAGKTTILDAITLALFGKAARYDENKRAVPENMMSRGAGHCFSEVRFSAGGDSYTVRWDLQRARKKAAGKIQAPKRQLADATGTILETKLKAVDEKVTEITGMDYPRFLRSVLLAQGRFREFLDAGEKERGDLLERITGTEIYSQLSKLAYDAAKEREEAIADARRSIAMLTLLSEEEKAGFVEEQALLASQKEGLQTILTALSGRLTLHTQWKKGTAEKERFETETKAITKTGEALEPEQARLTRHEKAAPMEGDLRLWEAACTAIKGLETDEAQLKKKRSDTETTAAQALQQARESCTLQIEKTTLRIGKGDEKRRSLETAIATIRAWQGDHASDDQLEAALPGIRAQMGATGQNAERVKAAITAEKLTQKGITDQREALALSTKALCEAEAACSKAGNGVKAVAQELATQTPIAELTRRKEALAARQRGVADLKQVSEDHDKGTAAVTALAKEQKTIEASKTALTKETEEAATALELARKTLADKETIHQQALLIESFADKRTHLLEGEPCPLCGALDHPYATGTTGAQPRKTEAERDFAKEHLRACEATEKKLERRMAKEASDLSGISASLKIKTAELQGLDQRYSALLSGMAVEVAIGDSQGLATLGAKVQEELTSLCRELKAVEVLEKSHTAAEKMLMETQKETASQTARAQQLKLDLDRLNGQFKDQLASRKAREAELTSALEDAFQGLSTWDIPAPEKPGLPPLSEAVNTLESRAATWANQAKVLLKNMGDLDGVNAGIKALTVQIDQLRGEEAQWQEKGAPFESRMGNPLAEPSAPLDPVVRRELCEKALAQVTRVATQLAATKEQLQRRRADGESRQKELLLALAQSGFQEIKALKEALLPPETRTDITTRIEAHKKKTAQISALAKENREALEALALKLPPSDEEALEIGQEKGKKEHDRDELLKQVGEIDQKLKADASARLAQAKQIERIEGLEKEARPWRLLKDLIGSADGTKFSRFAQGLTLGQLVTLANRHLKTLNPRYEIRRIPTEDLGLEIVDRYQADAVRPTNSLSGGESFLVSLALALGLSEMAGQKTRIESLFIDEGFGSLDTESLDTALAALENLRLENRTIGVISHVDLLKNRIGAQIEVTRNADGHASVSVVDS